ncbi:MAG: hypothetical protein ABS56_11040 [Lautropia sp. SCN 69-89]|nr:MAG: hypothetical protein ABS56_11040 [Lautropia sp. SCN 69-89]
MSPRKILGDLMSRFVRFSAQAGRRTSRYEVSSRVSQRCTVGCGRPTSLPSSVWLRSCHTRRQAARIRRRKSGSALIVSGWALQQPVVLEVS